VPKKATPTDRLSKPFTSVGLAALIGDRPLNVSLGVAAIFGVRAATRNAEIHFASWPAQEGWRSINR
jgi:hypothetical protein